MLIDILFIVGAYLTGSVSAAIITCRVMGLPDPRSSGSKNPGATNVLRLGGKKAAIITLLGDLFKGLLPVLAAQLMQLDMIKPPKLHQFILESLTNAVLKFDAELNLDYINPAGEMLFAVSASRIIGSPISEILPGNQTLLDDIHKGLEEVHPFTKHEVQITLPGPRADPPAVL